MMIIYYAVIAIVIMVLFLWSVSSGGERFLFRFIPGCVVVAIALRIANSLLF